MENKSKILYLILGIGVGIIITNILHSFYPRLEYIELTDDMIIERATDLGMVKLKESIKIEKEPVDEKEEEEEEKEIEEVEEIVEEDVIVESGASLTSVARQLYKLGLIDDKEEFIIFVKDEKLDRRIITGRYKIRHNSNYSEIIKILTDRDYGKTNYIVK